MKKLVATMLVLSLAAISSNRAAADFVNGDFETGNLSGWTVTPTTNGQTFLQTAVLFDIDFGDPLPTSFVGRFQVGQITFQSGVPAGIELTQNLNLVSGQSYTISFDWSAHRDTTTGSNSQGGIFDLIVDGTVIASAAAGSTSSTNPKWGNLTTNYLAISTGSHTIGVRITRPFTVPGDLFQSVDNFSLTSSIPEPSSLALLGLGAVALFVRRRR